jgi:hypothetical protein
MKPEEWARWLELQRDVESGKFKIQRPKLVVCLYARQ